MKRFAALTLAIALSGSVATAQPVAPAGSLGAAAGAGGVSIGVSAAIAAAIIASIAVIQDNKTTTATTATQ